MTSKLLTVLLIVLIGIQIVLMLGRGPAPAAADSNSAIVSEMQKQTYTFKGIERQLEKVVYYMERGDRRH